MRRHLATLLVSAVVVLAACTSGGGGAVRTPSEGPAGTSLVPGSTVGTACQQTAEAGVVDVSIADFEFQPASVEASVGQAVTFRNAGFEPHNATVEAGCRSETLETGESDALAFRIRGTYPFACSVHPWMTGTITIAP